MTDKSHSRIRKALGTAVGVIFLTVWIGGMVWYFGFDKSSRNDCAHLAYGDQGDEQAAQDCADAQQDGR